MPKKTRFPATITRAVDAAKILGIRAGEEHRIIGVWPVVVDGRVFIRSWDRKPSGWYYAFKAEPTGLLQIGEREVATRAVPVRSERLRDAVDEAYAAKFTTPGALKYVRGFRLESRRATTTELVPR